MKIIFYTVAAGFSIAAILATQEVIRSQFTLPLAALACLAGLIGSAQKK